MSTPSKRSSGRSRRAHNKLPDESTLTLPLGEWERAESYKDLYEHAPFLDMDTLRERIEQVHQRALDTFQEQIGYAFQDLSLLRRALTHRSYANEFNVERDNQRLEFLGDAVLDLVVATELFDRDHSLPEGRLSHMRSLLVREEALAERARMIQLGEAVLLGKGEAATQGETKNSVLADAYEALLAAIYLDGGYNAIYGFTRDVFAPLVDELVESGTASDYKTQLQEHIQAERDERPKYTIVATEGPAHARIYKVHVTVSGDVLGHGQGGSKKAAQQDAARNALRQALAMDAQDTASSTEVPDAYVSTGESGPHGSDQPQREKKPRSRRRGGKKKT